MLPDGRRPGLNLPLGSGTVKAVDRASAIGDSALKVVADVRTVWTAPAEVAT